MPQAQFKVVKKYPEVGDIVRFMIRAHISMGTPYEIIGRVESDGGRYHAGNRFLDSAIGDIEIIRSGKEEKALNLLKQLMTMDVKGHALANRLQFSDAGRDILKTYNELMGE